MKRTVARITALIAAQLCAASLTAQQSARFTSGTNVVRIDALVADRGKPVIGLTAADFELTDNGVAQRIDLVSTGTTPLDIFLAFDTSRSLTPEGLRAFATAARTLVENLRPIDRVALITFNHRVVQRSALTHDAAQLTAGLASITPSGGTAMFDAVYSAISLHDAEPGRALLMLFGDGVDTASWLTEAKVLSAVRRSDLVIFPAAPYDERRHHGPSNWIDPFARSFLRALVRDSGGRTLEAAESGDMRGVFEEVLTEYQRRYLLAYTPTGVSDSGWHDVVVKLKNHSGSVVVRRGYEAKK